MDAIAIFIMLLFALLILAAIVFSVGVTALTFLRGLRRLRFSLRELMITVVSGGFCASLLTCSHDSPLFAVGIMLSEAYCIFLLVHILGVGSAVDANAKLPSPQQPKEL